MQNIINRGNRALDFSKSKIEAFKGQEKYLRFIKIFEACMKQAIANKNHTILLDQLDVELKMQFTINNCLENHLDLSEYDGEAWEEDIDVKIREIITLKNKLEIA